MATNLKKKTLLRGKDYTLVQTTLENALAAKVQQAAHREGVTVAGWLRRLVMREMGEL